MIKVAPRMTDEEADAWRDALFEHIKKQHPHLDNREEQWKLWGIEKSPGKFRGQYKEKVFQYERRRRS